jgi:transposase-like protein
MVPAEPSRPPHVDRRALRAVLGGLERAGIDVDRDIALVWAGIVRQWPDIPVDPTAEQRETARRMFASGATMSAIATEMRVSRHRIAVWVGDLPQRPGGRGHAIPDDLRRRALDLVEAGLTHERVAHELGLAQSTVTRYVQQARSAPDQSLAA